MAKATGNNATIRSVYADNHEVNITQFADNATLILIALVKSLSSALELVQDLNKIPGLDGWIGSIISNNLYIAENVLKFKPAFLNYKEKIPVK